MEIGANLRRQVSWQSREKYSEKAESVVSLPETVTNAIRKSTRWYPKDYPRNRVQGGPVYFLSSSMTYLLATTVTDERARIARIRFLAR
ncbi:hypothetical protein ALC56_12456 [Trachymyrmex septentrionalis]|uniref:Uncharacterized protein n=1 Tax=Trachymyrmex septentrionalis TaxID=34720 RepID=A0A195EZG7_9HYME|nr:hypothetical protein ALC56_12456 [Trachymyrmex septentrionalis]